MTMQGWGGVGVGVAHLDIWSIIAIFQFEIFFSSTKQVKG